MHSVSVSAAHFQVAPSCSRSSKAGPDHKVQSSVSCYLRSQHGQGGLQSLEPVRFLFRREKSVLKSGRQVDFTRFRCTSDTPTRELSPAEQELWQRSCENVVTLGFTLEEADGMVAKAFGWKRSAYWGEEKTSCTPDPDSISAVLSYLRELGLCDVEVSKVVKKLPEVLGLLVEEEMKTNVARWEKSWGISGKALKNLLLRTPGALGLSIDCKGDCQGLCTRCWARL